VKRDFRFFEAWCAKMNMRAVGRYPQKNADILVADSGEPFVGANDKGIIGRWYRTGYAIDQQDKTWLASFHDYPAADYDLLSRAEGQKRRVNECLEHAKKTLNQTAAAGLYDDGRKDSFSIRPN
jgi:hypothetical protein